MQNHLAQYDVEQLQSYLSDFHKDFLVFAHVMPLLNNGVAVNIWKPLSMPSTILWMQ
jgi:hypothetical protein